MSYFWKEKLNTGWVTESQSWFRKQAAPSALSRQIPSQTFTFPVVRGQHIFREQRNSQLQINLLSPPSGHTDVVPLKSLNLAADIKQWWAGLFWPVPLKACTSRWHKGVSRKGSFASLPPGLKRQTRQRATQMWSWSRNAYLWDLESMLIFTI